MTSPTQAQHSERSNPMGPDFNHANDFNSLDLTTRSLITVAMLTALGKQHELKGHVRGALNNGVTPEGISKVLLHASIDFFCINDTTDDALPLDPRLTMVRATLQGMFAAPSSFELGTLARLPCAETSLQVAPAVAFEAIPVE